MISEEQDTEGIAETASETDLSVKSNCIGYALYELGLIPEDIFIQPGSTELINKLFDRVETIEEADAIAAIADLNKDRKYGPDPLLHLSHMAIVDKSRPGFVKERERMGVKARETTLKHAFRSYAQPHHPDDIHELVYLRKKTNLPQAANFSA